jgi:hypothetical protein
MLPVAGMVQIEVQATSRAADATRRDIASQGGQQSAVLRATQFEFGSRVRIKQIPLEDVHHERDSVGAEGCVIMAYASWEGGESYAGIWVMP